MQPAEQQMVNNRLAPSRNGHIQVAYPLDSRVVADLGGTRIIDDEDARSQQARKPRPRWRRWFVVGLVVAAVLWAGHSHVVPYVREMLETVETDDAFVAGHITYVSPRIEDVVTEVLVDQNDRVEPGELLVKLDREPFDVAVAQAEASLDESRANVAQSRAQVRSEIAQARAAYYRRKNAQETLRRQIATLKAQFATLKAQQSSRWLAEVDQRRIDNLVKRGSASQSELDQRNNTLKVAEEREKEAWEALQETRAQLGLPPDYKNPLDIPKELENQQSTVQSAVSDIASSLAQVGIPFDPRDAAQAKAFEDFLRPEGDNSAGEGLEPAIEQAPAVRVARAAVARALKAARRCPAPAQLDRDPLRDRRLCPGPAGPPGQPGPAGSNVALDPAELRLDRRQLQGDPAP